MEAQRLAVICSHLRQVNLGPSTSLLPPTEKSLSSISISSCVSSSGDKKGKKESEEESEEKNCVFCRIIRGEIPCFKVYEDDVCLCILDTNPLTHGHSLLIPKCHFSSLKSTPPSVLASMCSKIPFVSSAIMKATNSDSFNLVVNNGAAAGQVIFHTHLHIVPRKDCDQLWKTESFMRKPLKFDERTAELVSCIQKKLSTDVDSTDVKPLNG